MHCVKTNECGLSLSVCVLKWLSAWGLNYIQISPLFRVFSAQRQFSGPWVIAFHACLLRTNAATNLARKILWIHCTRRGRADRSKSISCLRPKTPRPSPQSLHESRVRNVSSPCRAELFTFSLLSRKTKKQVYI